WSRAIGQANAKWPLKGNHQVISINEGSECGSVQRLGGQGETVGSQAPPSQAFATDIQVIHTKQRQGLQIGAQVLLLQHRWVLLNCQLEYAVIQEQHADGQVEGAPGQGNIQCLAGAEATPRAVAINQ